MQALLQQFLSGFFRLVYEAWVAPPDKAAELISALCGQVVYLLVVFLLLRWLWRKLFK